MWRVNVPNPPLARSAIGLRLFVYKKYLAWKFLSY
jgi:hypothetical protein